MSQAIASFVDSPNAAGLGVGLAFFPVQIGTVCDGAAYANPVVPIAPLPGNAGPIKNAIGVAMPNGGTPTAQALQGAIDYARRYTMQQMGTRTAAVLLVTDGTPTGCTTNTVQAAADFAKAGFASTPSIKTFVVGMGNTAALDQVALAGSGGATHYIPTMGDVAGTLTKALRAISSMSTCVYSLPAPPTGSPNPLLVNLQFNIPGSAPRPIPKVSSDADCMTAHGWYYDNPTLPTSITLCSASCNAIQATPGTTVQIAYGCPSIVR
jgi:uncharacterized protein YegL